MRLSIGNVFSGAITSHDRFFLWSIDCTTWVPLGAESQMKRGTTKRNRGAVMVEYALLLTFFAVPVAGGITAAGAQMLTQYRASRAEVLAPFP